MTPLLSICIPTYNRLEILKNTITSIYADTDGVNMNDFEVIITDNTKEHTALSIINSFQYSNLHYYPTDCEGFKNSYFAMLYGQGEYLKLNNNYTKFKKGTLKQIIDTLKETKKYKTQIIYTNGLCSKKGFKQYNSFDQYLYNLSYFCSWSAGYGMWKEDFDRIKDSINLNSYFPQTSLLLTQNYKISFAIDNRILFEDQYVPKKGGYNIFKVFSVDFLGLIIKSYENKIISLKTLKKIKRELLYKYLSIRYFKTVIARLDNFDTTDIKNSITTYYSSFQYYLMILIALFAPFINLYKKVRRIY